MVEDRHTPAYGPVSPHPSPATHGDIAFEVDPHKAEEAQAEKMRQFADSYAEKVADKFAADIAAKSNTWERLALIGLSCVLVGMVIGWLLHAWIR